MTLTDFLLARIAEDEGWAEWYRGPAGPNRSPLTTARVLAECEAKRRIVEAHNAGGLGWALTDPTWFMQPEQDATLRFLALPYADHPDYRDEWRP